MELQKHVADLVNTITSANFPNPAGNINPDAITNASLLDIDGDGNHTEVLKRRGVSASSSSIPLFRPEANVASTAATHSAFLDCGHATLVKLKTAFVCGDPGDKSCGEEEDTEHTEVVVKKGSEKDPEPVVVKKGSEEDHEPVSNTKSPGASGDAIDDAFPEELQAASLTLLQRELHPSKNMPAPLREAAASVERAGRLLQDWVGKRQKMALVLPSFHPNLEACWQKISAPPVGPGGEVGAKIEATTTTEESSALAISMSEVPSHRNAKPSRLASGMLWMDQEPCLQGRHALSATGSRTVKRTPTSMRGLLTVLRKEEKRGLIPPEFVEKVKAQMQEAASERAGGQEVLAPGEYDCGELKVPPQLLAAQQGVSHSYWAFDSALSDAQQKVGSVLDTSTRQGLQA